MRSRWTNAALFSELTGYIPVTKEAAETDRIKKLWNDQPEYRVAFDQLEYAFPRPGMKGYGEIKIKIEDEMRKALVDTTVPPEQAVQSAAKEVQKLLDEGQQ
ncbi:MULTISPECIES: type 2 periplasmic-binding domain-containing protein [Bacillus]|uniref:ABC transporter substrate-binding protein n=2 Tax=Bacillus TaxID=1386 RepID=A0A0M4FUW4_9BACI|nr:MULTISPECIES: hypothetical protein [Bacillus]ALC80350.1 hypothetical protein AM592_01085 [Bacillus gobiensis]MBP1083806.1 sn-glycerol 3-phosphate transport system substrate-binding protein [Bacillus capparidis]MED1098291.1 hypothetical protein [Bacillus capparidis]